MSMVSLNKWVNSFSFLFFFGRCGSFFFYPSWNLDNPINGLNDFLSVEKGDVKNKTIKINFTVVFPECFRLYFSIVLKLYWETVKHDFLSGTLPLGGIYKSTWKRKGKYLSKWTNFDSDIKEVFIPVYTPQRTHVYTSLKYTWWGLLAGAET